MGTVAQLVARLEAAREAYYNRDPVLSDAAFDSLEGELRRLDPANAYFRHHGAAPTGTKVRHEVPMGSLNKADDVAEMEGWYTGCGGRSAGAVLVSDKLDGASLSLKYEDGYLVQAATRGRDGVGEDVTANVRRMQGLPARAGGRFTGHVRGEVIVKKSDFARHFSGESNPRNTANGTMKRKSDTEPCRHLTVVCYEMLPADRNLPTKRAEFEELRRLGFRLPRWWACEHGPPEIAAIYEKDVGGERAKLDYQIDGLVLYVDDNRVRASLGEEGGNPRGAVALKFPRDGAETTLRDVVWQVGASGRVTPVAHFDPVQLAGATVRQATLHCAGQFRQVARDAGQPWFHIGDRLHITRAGDVIPFVEALVGAGNGRPLAEAVRCPVCETALVEDGEYLVCPNRTGCPAQTAGRILNWTSKLGVLGWGDELVAALVDRGKVLTPADLYRLDDTDLANTRMSGRVLGESKAATIRAALHAKKELPLALIVGSLGIPLWGRSMTALLVAAGVDSLEKMREATAFDLACVAGVGDVKAAAFVEGFAASWPLIADLIAVGVAVAKPRGGAMRGKVVCFTGFRDQTLREAVEAAGGEYKDGMSRAVNMLVVKDASSTSSKVQAARKNGCAVVSVEELRRMTLR